MKESLIYLVLLLSTLSSLHAQTPAKTEAELIDRLFSSLQKLDSKAYQDLFPGIDSMSKWVLQYAEPNSPSHRKMTALSGNPYMMMEFDSSIHEEIQKNYTGFMASASMLGVHFDESVFIRYEFEKIRRGRGLITEKIAPLRFMGYVFFKDMFSRKTYGFTVYNIMQVNGLWYGGELNNIYEADSKEAYQLAEAEEKKRQKMRALGIEDTSAAAVAGREMDDEEKPTNMKQIQDRKFYKGMFDNEIPVQLYVRYIKGGCPEVICSWEAVFKFGDNDEFVKMMVSKTADGKWLFVEDPENGSMELTLNGKIYTGTWAADDTKTEYDAKLEEVPISAKKAQLWDRVIDQGLYGPQKE